MVVPFRVCLTPLDSTIWPAGERLRMAVIFRDARDMIISEHRMLIEVYHRMHLGELEPYILSRFQVIFQRYCGTLISMH